MKNVFLGVMLMVSIATTGQRRWAVGLSVDGDKLLPSIIGGNNQSNNYTYTYHYGGAIGLFFQHDFGDRWFIRFGLGDYFYNYEAREEFSLYQQGYSVTYAGNIIGPGYYYSKGDYSYRLNILDLPFSVGLRLPLGTSKLSWYGTLGAALICTQSEAYQYNYTSNNSYNFSGLGNTNYSGVSTLNNLGGYLSITTGVQYQISPRFSLFGGVEGKAGIPTGGFRYTLLGLQLGTMFYLGKK